MEEQLQRQKELAPQAPALRIRQNRRVEKQTQEKKKARTFFWTESCML